ncbi:HdeD family acid-resistance protein [Nocardioides mesophilus]|uniref:DUF308 domain-containing protein n=1 Tax=Nocardioides mesophilus TaxID=433659 RepID=A0A7G9RBH2_9ACTN|nr:DUF308 domain-containing protein [Nocardioides mesophilus]QNN52947.1 DUF308 domain-containing protein [Nocardioides mesophilus]
MSMSQFQLRRTGWDIVLGVLLVIGGLVILGDAAFATTVSVLFLGWVLLLVGIVGLVAALFRIGKGGFWSAALSGGLLTVLGLFFLRNTDAGAVTLTLIAGTLFLTSGIVRLVVSAQEPENRAPLLLGGVVSTALGLIVLLNLFDASLVLLGVLLGIQVLVDGIMLMLVGRWHATPVLSTSSHHAPAH